MKFDLERENATYERERANLAIEREGYFALIKGDEVVGTYVAYEDAMSVGYDKFGLDGFFCKEIHAVEPVHFIPYELNDIVFTPSETTLENQDSGVTIPVTQGVAQMEFNLDKEIATYERERENLAAENEGKFVLIKGDQIVGIYAAYEDAMSVGYDKFDLDGFFCKEIHAVEPVLFV